MIRNIILANFKAGVSEKELLKKNRGISLSIVYRHYSNLKSEKEQILEKRSRRRTIINVDVSDVIL